MFDHPIFATPAPVPADLAERAAARGWPEGLLQEAADLRVGRRGIEYWLDHDRPTVEEIRWYLAMVAGLQQGPLRVRTATWRDNDALVDLYADAPEKVGDLVLTVERGPNPYAQFRLQEQVHMPVIECKGVLLAATAHSNRNALIGGQRFTVHHMSAWRVRSDFRGKGLSGMLQMAAGPGTSSFAPVTYWYERSGNASQGWLDKVRERIEAGGAHKVEGLSATVHAFAPQPVDPLPPELAVRPVRREDVARCVELVNATHAGLDLFRPYTPEFLEGRLDDCMWGPKPAFWSRVYGWDDYMVVEEGGEVVACGGLWDKGRDVREVWRHSETGETRTVTATALLDWGHAPGYEQAMAALVRHFLVRTGELDRTVLLAPLEHAPGVLALVKSLDPSVEARALRVMGFHEDGVHVEPHVTRPYTDLAYW